MNKVIVGLFTVFALGLAGFTGCEGEKSAAPNADDYAWCKTKYTDQASCDADAKCVWKLADPDKGKADRCVAK